MNAPIPKLNTTMAEVLRDQAGAIYRTWIGGHEHTARAMIHQVPHHRTAYVVMTMTVIAVHEGRQYDFSKFIEGATR